MRIQGAGPQTRERILEALAERAGEAPLHEVATALGLAPPTVHRHLRQLVDDGRVAISGHGPATRYTLRPLLEVAWTAQLPSGAWERFRWNTHEPVDWRFPLVSRVPDARGQASILRFLEAVWVLGILTPWIRFQESPPARDENVEDARYEKILDRLASPKHHEHLTFVVYGSCARGDARPDSDVDIMVVTPAQDLQVDPTAALERVCEAVSLGTPRPIDLITVQRDSFFDDVPVNLRQRIEAEGITVYSSGGGRHGLEGW